mgnify:CR=1 FL=1
MIKEEQNPVGPVLTAAESRRRVLHNMCSSLLYNLSVILFGLLLPRLYLTSFGSELNGLDSTIKQIFSCLTLLEAGVGLASQQAYYLPVAVGDRKAINGIFSATHHYYRRTGIVYLLVTVVFALLYPLCINTVLSYGTVSLIVVFYGIPAHHELHRLSGGKGGAIAQLQRLPILRDGAEAVEHRAPPGGEVERKGRGISGVLRVERCRKAAAGDALASAAGGHAAVQTVKLLQSRDIPAVEIACAHRQGAGREVLHREVDQHAAQPGCRRIAQQLHRRFAVQQGRLAHHAGLCRSRRNACEQGSSQTDRARTGTFQERPAGKRLRHRGLLLAARKIIHFIEYRFLCPLSRV